MCMPAVKRNWDNPTFASDILRLQRLKRCWRKEDKVIQNVKYLVLQKLLAYKIWYYLNFSYLCSVIKKQVVTIKTNSHETVSRITYRE